MLLYSVKIKTVSHEGTTRTIFEQFKGGMIVSYIHCRKSDVPRSSFLRKRKEKTEITLTGVDVVMRNTSLRTTCMVLELRLATLYCSLLECSSTIK